LNSKVSFKVSFSLQLHDYGREKKMRGGNKQEENDVTEEEEKQWEKGCPKP
jgi:hypothetical protein